MLRFFTRLLVSVLFVLVVEQLLLVGRCGNRRRREVRVLVLVRNEKLEEDG